MPPKETRRIAAAAPVVILGVTGSVAIYKAGDLIRRLRDRGCSVDVVMTRESEEFIRPLLWEALTGRRAYRGLFDSPETWEVEHISLAERARAVLIAPATAQCIAKVAGGLCDDLLSCIISATKAPVIFCPAMNAAMYTNPITQGNIRKLAALGYVFVEPRVGKLACGTVGPGCLADTETILAAVDNVLKTAA